MKVAVVENATVARELREAHESLRDAQERELRVAKNLETARQVTARRRLDFGRMLIEARKAWPARGPKAKGWGQLLAAAAIDQDVALAAMKYAGYVDEFPGTLGDVPGNLPTLREAGLDDRPLLSLVPPSIDGDDDEEPGAGPEVDRNSWCTPKDIAVAIGKFDVDPCSNKRSHIRAGRTFDLEDGEDGLRLAMTVQEHERVYINPPYEGGQVIKWVRAYAHTRFCFLLRLDTSTAWFDELYQHTELVLIPRGERVQFEPPPGVAASSNPYPHGLFYAFADDAEREIMDTCYRWFTGSKAAR